MTALILGVAMLSAPGAPVPAAPPTPAPAGRFEGRFADGSVVALNVLEGKLTVATKYGRLVVPLEDVKRIEFGFRYPDGAEAKIEALASDLGSTDFKTREAAQKQLVGYGELALPAARRAAKGTVAEASRRGEEIVAKLEATLPKEKLELREFDTVVTVAMTVKGKIETESLKAKSTYFGEATLKLADLRALRPLGVATTETVTVDAGKYAKQGWAAWFDTAIDVTTEGGLDIAASGKIDQWAQQPGQYVSGPAGNNAVVMGPGQQQRGFNPGQQQFKAGALYGRVGDKGEPFYIGDGFRQAKVAAAGRLYLIIGPSNWNNDSSGEYKVTVKAGE